MLALGSEWECMRLGQCYCSIDSKGAVTVRVARHYLKLWTADMQQRVRRSGQAWDLQHMLAAQVSGCTWYVTACVPAVTDLAALRGTQALCDCRHCLCNGG